jgi:uncharacterized protein (DUF4213/DUF364 family)
MILDKTITFLKEKYIEQIENLKIDEVRIGALLSAVKLSDGSYGVASTLQTNQHHCSRDNRDFGDFTPTRIQGQKVVSLFEVNKKSNIIDTLKIAVLNALSSTILKNEKYKILEDVDPISLIDLGSNKTITIVGAFRSYIELIATTSNKLHVLELTKEAFDDDYVKYYVPAHEYTRIIPQSDVVIITGLTLVNNTIDGLLSVIKPTTKVIVTGPSSSIIPDVLFDNKVNIIGATRITKPEILFALVSEFGAGFHLFKYCAQKICILNE